jgi:hypothetical protein
MDTKAKSANSLTVCKTAAPLSKANKISSTTFVYELHKILYNFEDWIYKEV